MFEELQKDQCGRCTVNRARGGDSELTQLARARNEKPHKPGKEFASYSKCDGR